MNNRSIILMVLVYTITIWTAQAEDENQFLKQFIKEHNLISEFEDFSKQKDVINTLDTQSLHELQLQLNAIINEREQAATDYDRHNDDDDFDRTQWLIQNGYIDRYNGLKKVIEKKKKEEAGEIPEAILLEAALDDVQQLKTPAEKLARLKREINRLEAKVEQARRYDKRIKRIDDLLHKEEDYGDAYNLYQKIKSMITELETAFFHEKAGILKLSAEVAALENIEDKVAYLHTELAVFEDKLAYEGRFDDRIQMWNVLTPEEYAKYLAIRAELNTLYAQRPDLKPVHALLQLVSMAKTAICSGFSYITNAWHFKR